MKKETKNKLIGGVVWMLTTVILDFLLTRLIIDILFTHTFPGMSITYIFNAYSQWYFNDPLYTQLFFVVIGLSFAVILYISLKQGYGQFDSETFFVTPDIEKPVKAGQGQCGNAKWLNREDAGKVFAAKTVNRKDKQISELLLHGAEDFNNDYIVRVVNTESNGTPIRGSVFGVYMDGKLISTMRETDIDGESNINLSVGRYELRQLSAGLGYDIDPHPYAVNVGIKKKETVITVNVVNRPFQNELKILSENPAILRILKKNNRKEDWNVRGEEFRVRVDGEICVKLPYGCYALQNAVDENSGVAWIEFTDPGQSFNVNLDSMNYGAIDLIQTDGTECCICDGAYNIYRAWDDEYICSVVFSGAEPVQEELEIGNYYLQMISAPTGYQYSAEKLYFTIPEEDIIKKICINVRQEYTKVEVYSDATTKYEILDEQMNNITAFVTSADGYGTATLNVKDFYWRKAGESVAHRVSTKDEVVMLEDTRTQKPIDAEDDFDAFGENGGVVLGYRKKGKKEIYYYVGEDAHSLTIGATRSGKTRTTVLQSIGVQALAGENIICSDPKGELFLYTNQFLKKLNYNVLPFNFKNPLLSVRYNFLQPIIDAVDQKDMPKAIQRIWDLTASLVGESKTGEQIWTNGEASVIAGCIMIVVLDSPSYEYKNLTNVYHFISDMCKMNGDQLKLNDYLEKLSHQHPARMLMGISEVAPSRTRGSFFTSALATLRLFTDPLISYMTSVCDFSLAEISKKKTALFMILPDSKTTYYSLASLFIHLLYQELSDTADRLGGRLPRKINFDLDEFGNFAVIPDFDVVLTVAGGRGMRFNLYLQSFKQLEKKYGKETAAIIMGNTHYWLYLKSDDPETLEIISKRLGNYTAASNSRSANYTRYQHASIGESQNLVACPMLSADELTKIKRPYTLVLSRNDPCMMISPDISEQTFNAMYGLGDMHHNQRLRVLRELAIPQKIQSKDIQMKLWNIEPEHRTNDGFKTKLNQ